MKKGIILLFLLHAYYFADCQILKKPVNSVYAFYGRHFSTNYDIDSGKNNLVGRKYNWSLEIGLNLDYPINERWKIRTGMNAHVLFMNEVLYGISGPVPPGVDTTFIHIFTGGLVEYIESASISIPIKPQYIFLKTKRTIYTISGGPSIAIYFPASDEKAGVQVFKDNALIRQHWVTRHFKNYKSLNTIGISYPQLEWDLTLKVPGN